MGISVCMSLTLRVRSHKCEGVLRYLVLSSQCTMRNLDSPGGHSVYENKISVCDGQSIQLNNSSCCSLARFSGGMTVAIQEERGHLRMYHSHQSWFCLSAEMCQLFRKTNFILI